MKIVISAILLTLVHVKAYAQSDFIKWNKNVTIGWSDFKGKANAKSPFGAMSAVGIYYKYHSESNGKAHKIKFTINARFDRSSSWSKKNARTAAILQHEQLHFDIAELVTRAFKKEAENTVYSRNHKIEISRIFNRYTANLQKLQRKYDDQTLHSNNKKKQKEWEKLIHQELLQ